MTTDIERMAEAIDKVVCSEGGWDAQDLAQAAYDALVGDGVVVPREALLRAKAALQNSSEVQARYVSGENEQDRSIAELSALIEAKQG